MNQKLKHGKALCGKVFAKFVETFNWLVDFNTNLKGDADVNEGLGSIKIDRADPAHPIIRFVGNIKGGDSGGGEEEPSDPTDSNNPDPDTPVASKVEAGDKGVDVQGKDGTSQKIYVIVTEGESGKQIVDLSTSKQPVGDEAVETSDDKDACNKWSKDKLDGMDGSDEDSWSGSAAGGGSGDGDLPDDEWSGNPCPQE